MYTAGASPSLPPKSRGDRGLVLECLHNTGIPGRRPGRRIPGRLVGIVSSLEDKFSEKLFENRPGSTT